MKETAMLKTTAIIAPRVDWWAGLVRLAGLLTEWQSRAEQREVLASLDDRQLEDIGVSRAEVRAEIAKPFWRA
jgi:uncharacterized protein YjiS (DUF1127 family)